MEGYFVNLYGEREERGEPRVARSEATTAEAK